MNPFTKDVIDAAATEKEVTDPAEARASSTLYMRKYRGGPVKASKPDEPLTPGEMASFELLPAQ